MLNRLNELDYIESFVGIHTSGLQRHNLDFDKVLPDCQTKKSILLHNHDYLFCLNLREGENEEKFQLIKMNPKITVLFYGEMYNFDELCAECGIGKANSKTISFSYLCCILYQKYGLQFTNKINGLFSTVLIDENEKKLHLFADRFGSAKPIYYYVSDKIIFSNQLRILLKIDEINRVIDEEAMAVFLKYSYVPSPRTILRGVFKLGPGEMLVYKEGKIKNQRYANFLASEKSFPYEDTAVEEYLEIINSSIRKKIKGFDSARIGFFLSGGLDSSANVALASLSGLEGFKTFGIGFEDSKIDERPYARIVANHFGVPFYEYVFDGSEIEELPRMVWYLDEPFMENGLFLTYAGFKAAKGEVDLIIAGDGADQLFGTGGFADGRPIALRFLLERLYLRTILDKARKHLIYSSLYRDTPLYKAKVMFDRSADFNDWFFWGFDENELAELCRFSINENSLKCFSNDVRHVSKTLADYYQHALVHQDLEHYACQNVIVKSFRMAEMNEVLLREAYLDELVIDFVLSLAFGFKTKGGLWDFLRGKRVTKYMHRFAMNDILPEEILRKPKQGGFVPMTFLLKNTGRRKKIFDYLTNANPLERHLNMGFLTGLLRDYEDSLSKNVYWQAYHESKANQIMNLLALSLWHEIIGKRQFPKPPKDSLSEFLGY